MENETIKKLLIAILRTLWKMKHEVIYWNKIENEIIHKIHEI